eukprot:1155547-Pleurochrysis_carterae.AAC.1
MIEELKIRPNVHEGQELLAFRHSRMIGVARIRERLELRVIVFRFAVHGLIVRETASAFVSVESYRICRLGQARSFARCCPKTVRLRSGAGARRAPPCIRRWRAR